VSYLRAHHAIGDILEVVVDADFDFKVDSRRPRAVIEIRVDQERVESKMTPAAGAA